MQNFTLGCDLQKQRENSLGWDNDTGKSIIVRTKAKGAWQKDREKIGTGKDQINVQQCTETTVVLTHVLE